MSANQRNNGAEPARGQRSLLSASRAFAIIFVVAFLVRGALLFSWMTPREYIFPETVSEAGRAAYSLALTGHYADPYILPTGPTAHSVPLYTGLLALIYSIFGVTMTAGWVRCVQQIASYSAMYALIPWVAGKLGVDRRAGFISGMIGALIPYQGVNEVLGWMGSETYAGILLGVLLAVLAMRWSAGTYSPMNSLLIGVGFGVGFHLAPPLLPVMLGCMLFECWWRRGRGRCNGIALMALAAALVCIPWAWRNYAAFGELFFIRSNFGLELRLANHDGAVADVEVLDEREGDSMRHPGCNRQEARLCSEIGEMEYMRRARREAFAWIGAHPAEFTRLTASRVLHFWCGPLSSYPTLAVGITLITVLALLGLWHVIPVMTPPQRAALLIPLIAYPLIHYLVVYMPRYRVPLDWMLLLLAGAAIWHWLSQLWHATSENSVRTG